MFTYNTKGTCSRQIIFDVDGEHKLHNVKFIGGCGGNLQGIARLVEGKDIDEVAGTLKGIKCRTLSRLDCLTFTHITIIIVILL